MVLRVSTNFLVDTGHCAGYTVEHLKFPVLSPTVRLSEFPDENDVEPLFTVSATWTASLVRRLFDPGLPVGRVSCLLFPHLMSFVYSK